MNRLATTIDDLPVSFLEGGTADGGIPPVILLHGGGMDHAMLSWHQLIKPLSAQRAWIAPDQPGYGQSAPGTFTQDVAGFGQWLVRFMDDRQIGMADIAGVSMGGGVALWLALHHPGRLRKLMLVDPYGIAPKVMMQRAGALFSRLPLTRLNGALMGQSRWLTRKVLELVFHDPSKLTDEVVDMAHEAARETSGFASFNRFQNEEVRWSGLKTSYAQRMDEITQPTLCIHGRYDALVPLAEIEPAIAAMPNGRLEVLETGHWPMLEAPEQFNTLALEFLA